MQFHVHPLTPCGIQGLTSAVCPLSRQFEPFSHGFFSFLFSSDFPFLPLVAGGRAAGLNCSHVPPSQGGFHRFHCVLKSSVLQAGVPSFLPSSETRSYFIPPATACWRCVYHCIELCCLYLHNCGMGLTG